MSAAKKLRVLDETMPHATTHLATWPLFWEFRNALAQVIAVVEAAERRAHQDDQGFLTGINHPTPCKQCEALAALDKALP